MAPRGSKRTAAQSPAEEPSAKRVTDFLKQQRVTRASYQPVIDSIEHPLTGLPEDARRMLLAALPWSILVPAEERHEAQAAAVHMVDAVVEGVQAELEKAQDVEARKVAELEGTKAELEAAAQSTEAAELESRRIEDECHGFLAETDAALPQKSSTLEAAKLEKTRLGAELEQTDAHKTELEEVFSGSFARLREGSHEDGEAESLVKAVTAIGKSMCLEESLLLALPNALVKRDRGAFDVAVVEQADHILRSKIAALCELSQAAVATLATQAAQLQTAQVEYDAATAAQVLSADRLRQAQEASSAAATSAKAAKDAVIEIEAKLATATVVKHEKSAELEQFCSYNVFMYKMLRDRVPSKRSEEPAPKEVAATDEAAEAEAEAVEESGEVAATDEPSKESAALQGGNTLASLAGA